VLNSEPVRLQEGFRMPEHGSWFRNEAIPKVRTTASGSGSATLRDCALCEWPLSPKPIPVEWLRGVKKSGLLPRRFAAQKQTLGSLSPTHRYAKHTRSEVRQSVPFPNTNGRYFGSEEVRNVPRPVSPTDRSSDSVNLTLNNLDLAILVLQVYGRPPRQ